MVERNYNLIELGPWGTGKSFVYRETSQIAMFISGATSPRSIPVLWEHVTSSTAGTPRWFSHKEASRITSRAGFLWLSLETSDHQEISNRAEQFVSIEQAVDLALRPLRRADEAAELARPPQTGGEVLLLQVRDAVGRRRVRPQEVVPGGDTERPVWAFVRVLFGGPERLRADVERMIEMEHADSVNRWTGEYSNHMVLDARSSHRYPSTDLGSLPRRTLHCKRPAQTFSSLAHRVQS